MRPVEKVLDRLEGTRRFNGSWKALCPAHEDREPSLSVTEGDDGRVLVKCFAGCDTENVVAALGLEMSDLFEKSNGHKKVFRSSPPENNCNRATVQPRELRRNQGLAGRVLTEAGSSGPEVSGATGGTHLVPGRGRLRGGCALQDRP